MDPIYQTLTAIYEAILENPAARGLLFGAIRNVTGYLYSKWYDKAGAKYSPSKAAATLLKYEVVVNAIATVLPPEQAGSVVLVADIVFGAARKMLIPKYYPMISVT